MTKSALQTGHRQPALLSSLIEKADAIPSNTSLRLAIETFRRFPRLRFLAVVDSRKKPIGAIHEQLIRDLLFSPFGHALLANPGYPWTLEDMVQPCPIADVEAKIDAMVAAHSRGESAEGLILTRNGRYFALLPAQGLLVLSAHRDRQEQEKRIVNAETAIARAEALTKAFDAFRAQAMAFSSALGTSAAEMAAAASGVADGAATNGKQALAVAAASRQSFDSISDVAQSSTELARQSKVIESRSRETSVAIERAVSHVADGAAKARSLAISADEIGGTVAVISEIAAQVNMLAINARIEAARAGPAGQSFAVVASEVKALALKAGKAARDIEARIHSVREAIAASAAANDAIETIVTSLAGAALGIREAVLEQDSATDQIAASAEECAQTSGEISANVTKMGERAATAGKMAVRLGDVANGLSRRAADLQDMVEAFLDQIGTLSGHASEAASGI